MLEILFLPIALMASLPGTALLPGTLFLILYFRRRKAVSGIRRAMIMMAAILWIAYGLYETRMYFWMQTVIAPIRVDLLLIAPLLYVVTVIGAIAAIRVKGGMPPGRK